MKQTLTLDQLTLHLEGLKKNARVLPLDELLSRQAISCVDGRNFTGVVATPGGNAGLFLQMLASYEVHLEMQFSREQVTLLFTSYLDRFGHFYLHSDAHALHTLVKTLQGKGSAISSMDQLISVISAPPQPLRPLLLEELSKPEHTGCGHIRLMMENPETYRIRPFLIQSFIQDFLLRFWRGDDRLQFDILHGDHAEQGILNIHIEEMADLDNTPLALIAPQLNDVQVFINHPEATAYMHRQHAEFLYTQELLDENDVQAYIKVHGGVHTSQLTATVQALGAGLPVFNVVLDESMSVQQVEQVG